MSTQYICELCSKEFKQKIDYTRHKDKKNACVTADKLKQVITQKFEKELEKKNEQKINHNSTLKTMSTLFSSCMNILRDNESLTGDKALRNLSYLLVLKLIEPIIGSEIDLESFDYLLPEKSKPNRHKFLEYTLFSKITSSKEDDIPKLLKDIWNHILSKHPKTKDIFLTGKGFDMKKQATFRKLIDKLSEFDFTSVDYDIQGHAYEDLLKDIMTGKVLGQFFTQPLVKDMMVDLINPQLLNGGKCETIFDPAMGTGGFLMTSLRHLQKQAEDKKVNIDWEFMTSQGLGGRETEPDTFQLCKTNMLVSCGHMLNNLQQGDSIRDPITEKYDIVLANPPFGIKGLEYQEIKNQDGVRDKYLPIESKSAVPLFLQAIISILKIDGRCAMVMPDGQELFGKGKALVALREYLMKTCELREVHYLPSGVFSNTSIKTCVLYFYKRTEGSDVVEIGGKKTRTYKFSSTLQTKKVQFYDYNPYEKVKNLLIEVDACKIAENNYSLNYAEYLQSEEQGDQDEKEHNSEVEWKTLGEVCEFQNGYAFKSKDFEKHCDNTVGIVQIKSIQSGYIDTNKITEFVKQDTNKFKKFEVISGDILIALSGATTGKIGVYNLDKISYLNQRVAKIICKNINSKFFYYWYLCCDVENKVLKLATGTAQPNISTNGLASLKIPIPSLQAQQRIVERLDYLYETCTETSRSLIEQSKTKKAMMVEMGTEGVQTKPLGEVCDFNIGGTPSRKEPTYWDDGKNLWISVRELNGGYIYDTNEKITDLGVKKSSVKLFPKDTVLFSFKLSIGKTAIVGAPMYTNEAIAGINTKDINSLLNKYLYYYLTITDFSKSGVGAMSNGSLNKGSLALIKIPIPSLQTQQRIVQECERLDKLITDLEADIESDKSLAASYLKSCIESPQEDHQEYTEIIISDEDYSETETKPAEEQQYTDIIISDEDYEEVNQLYRCNDF